MKCLFIGGPKAGAVIDVDPLASNAAIPVAGGQVIYRRGHVKNASGESRCVFHLQGEDPLDALMNYYESGDHS